MQVGRQHLIPLYLREDQRDAIKALAERLGQPQQVLLRQAVDDFLTKQCKPKTRRAKS